MLLLATIAGAGAAEASGFVACPSEGMMGPAAAPTRQPPYPDTPRAYSGRLALYASATASVVAPAGWHCLEVYGSGGFLLLVTPGQYTKMTVPDFRSLAGPAVELILLPGGTSARNQVAEILARLFPAKRAFIRAVTGDDLPQPHLVSGPFPTDTTLRRGADEVDTTTPPHHDGLGTYSGVFAPDGDPILVTALVTQVQGVDSMLLLDVRLPSRQRGLALAIRRLAVAAQRRGEILR